MANYLLWQTKQNAMANNTNLVRQTRKWQSIIESKSVQDLCVI